MGFERVAVALVAGWCALQLLIIGLATTVLTLFPVVRDTTPWYAPIVKTVAAIAIVSFSFYVCRMAVRSITTDGSSGTRKGMLGLVHLAVGVGFTAVGAFFLFASFIFSHGDQPHAPPYWVPFVIGGIGLLIFSTLCWLWWGILVLSHKQSD